MDEGRWYHAEDLEGRIKGGSGPSETERRGNQSIINFEACFMTLSDERRVNVINDSKYSRIIPALLVWCSGIIVAAITFFTEQLKNRRGKNRREQEQHTTATYHKPKMYPNM